MIPVKTIQDTIRSFDGKLSQDGFSALCMAIYEARLYQPFVPQMKVIKINIAPKLHKSATATAKALERAVYDLCTTADKTVLASYQRSWAYEPPKPKEFVFTMAQILWDGVDRSGPAAG